MERYVSIALSVIMFAPALIARTTTDVIVMKNGDRLTCEIKKLESGVLYASLDYVDGTIAISWSEVQRLESSQLFVVVTENGSTYTGTLAMASTGGQPRQIEIADDVSAGKALIPQAELVRAKQYGESTWQQFSGNLSTNVTFGKGNNSTQFNFASDLTYRRERSSLKAAYTSTYSAATGSETDARNQLDFTGQHLMRWDQWYYAGTAAFLRSSTQHIAFQSVWGGGLGYYLSNTPALQFGITAGVAYLDSRYRDDGDEKSLVLLLTGDLHIFQFKKTELTLTPVLLPSITDRGRVHFNVNSMYKIQIVSNFWWNISFYGNWDNRPPFASGHADYGTSSGLTYTFH